MADQGTDDPVAALGRATRRRFSDKENLRILEAADRCARPGELGLLLRREGIYSSHLATWRRWRRRAHPELEQSQRAPTESQLRHENARLEREVVRLRLKLDHADRLLALQKRWPRRWRPWTAGASSATGGRHEPRRRAPGSPRGASAPHRAARLAARAGGALLGGILADRSPRAVHAMLCATRPDQVWTWDIIRLRGRLGRWLCLYVVLDVYSRYAVTWLLAEGESGALAADLVRDAAIRRGVAPGALTLHPDRGAPMTSKPMAQMLADLRIDASHSRPRTSNDNPFSEAQFKTLKRGPAYPAGPGSLGQWRAWCQKFFGWSNREHRHAGIAFLTPEDVYLGRHLRKERLRQRTLVAAYAAHPERFVRGRPVAQRAPREVWINKPKNELLLVQSSDSSQTFALACDA